ncbi:hypothetical protein NYP18_01920 [Corynebacterium sp. YIM 101645]|uniref:Uncharacterized protein n=1 Tax=Corynebacterium lemuris TaxID=1859292 RepID=A0ABT2FTF0_9CORY|nr:hypothetical protein [Corynebacterium lemuris]MCS5478406.1 hypothetical protein [Corynebacterium lemuris]
MAAFSWENAIGDNLGDELYDTLYGTWQVEGEHTGIRDHTYCRPTYAVFYREDGRAMVLRYNRSTKVVEAYLADSFDIGHDTAHGGPCFTRHAKHRSVNELVMLTVCKPEDTLDLVLTWGAMCPTKVLEDDDAYRKARRYYHRWGLMQLFGDDNHDDHDARALVYYGKATVNDMLKRYESAALEGGEA